MENVGTILIVDDNPDNLALLMDLLVPRGYKVRPALSGEIALRAVAANPPELILLDVLMPDLDGYQTCQRLKADAASCDIPVIFISALRDNAEMLAGFQAGAVDYITKPFQIEEVLARVRTHLSLRRTTANLLTTLKQLNAVQEERAREQRREALTTLVVGIAHELNTPIGNGLTTASALLDQNLALLASMNSAEGVRRSTLDAYLRTVHIGSDLLVRNLRRAADLLNSFQQIAIGHYSRHELIGFSVPKLVNEIVLTMAVSLQRAGITVRQALEADLQLHSDPQALTLILTNLLGNTLLHAFEGRTVGCITITAQRCADETLELIIEDDGCGIPEANLGRIFEPFFTTKLGIGSSGMGLAIAYNLVTGVLGGTIAVYSEADLGSRFVLHLPLGDTTISAH